MLIKSVRELDTTAMRDAYCESLIKLGEEDDRVVSIEVDVMASMGTTAFAKKFPDRSINCGIQEANAVGMASGMAIRGYVPFFHAFGIFATRRVYDQIFLSCGYAKSHIKIIGGDAGVTASANGGTHMPLEDIGLMNLIPDMVIIEPADTVCVRNILEEVKNCPSSVYMRCTRKQTIRIYEDSAEFMIGKANVLREGSDVTILASGIMVAEALDSAEELIKRGISAEVIDCYSIKPFDIETVLKSVSKTKAVVTAENHNTVGGLGSTVASVLAQNDPTPMEMVGVKNRYGEVGTVEYLKETFGLTASDITKAVEKVLLRKTK